jgi:hypothetical protein
MLPRRRWPFCHCPSPEADLGRCLCPIRVQTEPGRASNALSKLTSSRVLALVIVPLDFAGQQGWRSITCASSQISNVTTGPAGPTGSTSWQNGVTRSSSSAEPATRTSTPGEPAHPPGSDHWGAV